MSNVRLEVITPCEHGYDLAHAGLSDRSEAIKRGVPDCPGESRLVYTREEATNYVASHGVRRDTVREVLDVLMGVGE